MSQPTTRSLLLAAMFAAAQTAAAVDYPADYRGWTHVKTLTLHADHPLADPFAGIHHVYANPAAVTGLHGGHYPDGAVLVFDLHEAVAGDRATAEGKRILLGVMQKDRARYSTTGGWGFDAWAGDSHTERLVQDGGKACFGCHTEQQEHDYVFSRWRE
ncbi:MAG: cytochrome P460 family protein [Pseudomonadota bacterium]